MATQRRYLMTFVAVLSDGPHFVNVTATIEGDLESGIGGVKKNMAKTLASGGFGEVTPVLLSALQLENIRPPHYVELPIMVRRSIEQLVIDWQRAGLDKNDAIYEIEDWLEGITEGK